MRMIRPPRLLPPVVLPFVTIGRITPSGPCSTPTVPGPWIGIAMGLFVGSGATGTTETASPVPKSETNTLPAYVGGMGDTVVAVVRLPGVTVAP